MTFPQTHRTLHEERVTMIILVPTMANVVEGTHPAKLTPVPTLLVLEVPTQESQADQDTPGVQDALAFRTHPSLDLDLCIPRKKSTNNVLVMFNENISIK